MWRKSRKKHNKKQENSSDLVKYTFSRQEKSLLSKTSTSLLFSSRFAATKKWFHHCQFQKEKVSNEVPLSSPEKHLLFS